jgi:hypothetical protein
VKETHFSERSPEIVFSHIRDAFLKRGLLGANLSVDYEGCKYRVSCDEKNFMVYRISENSNLRHHVPGWPVCLVNADTVFEECSSPVVGEDHCACDATVEKWLEIIDAFAHSPAPEIPQSDSPL